MKGALMSTDPNKSGMATPRQHAWHKWAARRGRSERNRFQRWCRLAGRCDGWLACSRQECSSGRTD